jgi:hypothetical protein
LGGSTVYFLMMTLELQDLSTQTSDPSFDGTTNPVDFRVGTGSYAANGGTAVFPATARDFFNCVNKTATPQYRIGSMVPKANSRCYRSK